MGETETRKKYERENTQQIRLKLNRKTDGDILGFLFSLDNKQGYIKRLIREDMAKNDSRKVDANTGI